MGSRVTTTFGKRRVLGHGATLNTYRPVEQVEGNWSTFPFLYKSTRLLMYKYKAFHRQKCRLMWWCTFLSFFPSWAVDSRIEEKVIDLGPVSPKAVELRLLSVLTIHLSYNGRRHNMCYAKHHTERRVAKCIVGACVDTDRIETEVFHNTDYGWVPREILLPTAANIEAAYSNAILMPIKMPPPKKKYHWFGTSLHTLGYTSWNTVYWDKWDSSVQLAKYNWIYWTLNVFQYGWNRTIAYCMYIWVQ